jgi:hypothetical protein
MAPGVAKYSPRQDVRRFEARYALEAGLIGGEELAACARRQCVPGPATSPAWTTGIAAISKPRYDF